MTAATLDMFGAPEEATTKWGVLFSAKTDEWPTPQDVVDEWARRVGPFTLDVAATALTSKAHHFFTKEHDGLAANWAAHVWWCERCRREVLHEVRRSEAENARVLRPEEGDAGWPDLVVSGMHSRESSSPTGSAATRPRRGRARQRGKTSIRCDSEGPRVETGVGAGAEPQAQVEDVSLQPSSVGAVQASVGSSVRVLRSNSEEAHDRPRDSALRPDDAGDSAIERCSCLRCLQQEQGQAERAGLRIAGKVRCDCGLPAVRRRHVAWANVPYSNVEPFVAKAIAESARGATVVMLLPARTDTRWFHLVLAVQDRAELWFLRGRLRFGDAKNSAPFPSMVVVFRPRRK